MRHGYIAIEGNIGAGKTSLAKKIAADFNGKLVLEEFADNPFLPKFYESPERYAFPVELSFLSERFSQLKNELNTRDLFSSFVVADYFLPKSQIFARANLDKDEYALFMNLFKQMNANLPKPDLLVYLQRDIASLQANIKHRGRSYEQQIEDAYLEKIEKSYMRFLKQHRSLKVIVVELGSTDFIADHKAYATLLDIIGGKHEKGVRLVSRVEIR